jgi:dihydropteroate synthase
MAEKMNNLPPFPWGTRTFIMGIINVTPDSFSGDGLLQQSAVVEAAVQQTGTFLEEGADIIDIGGESTRPGAAVVSAEEEIHRVVPVIEAIQHAFPEVCISIDTSKANVARAALDAGAQWVNDVWGLKADPGMAGVVADYGVPVILMHNRSKPGSAALEARLGGRYVGIAYENLMADICRELMASVSLALAEGVLESQIILDPGIGFGKTVSQNFEVIDRLEAIKSLGFSVLVGPSRKSFLGYTLDLPPGERVEGTAAAVALCIARGADIVRVHDVGVMSRVVRIADAIVRRETD